MELIPAASTDLSGKEVDYVLDAIKSTWISSCGKYVDRFEEEFAASCDNSHAVSCCNGTVALHLAMLAMGVVPGDEVILPSLTYIATANAVRHCGAIPVFVDVDPDNWCINPERLSRAVSPRTRGIIAVHLMGHPADMDGINEIADRHGLWVIEDAAEAHFARYKGRSVGSLGTLATFSFYGNKILTSGEGGAVLVNNQFLAYRLKMLRGHGMDPNNRHLFPIIGYNYRLTNLACAILCAQLERASEILSCRRQIFEAYEVSLKGIPGISFQPVSSWAEPAPWMFCIVIDPLKFGATRDELIRTLRAAQIDSRPFFYPVHLQKPYLHASAQFDRDLTVTKKLSESGLMLPTFSGMTCDQINRIASVIRYAAEYARPIAGVA